MNFLPPQTASRLIACVASEETVIVGGQAVGIWAQRYGLVGKDEPDARHRLYGGLSDVEAAGARLVDWDHKTTFASIDDAGPNSGLISVRTPELDDPVIIDFQWSVQGLSNLDLVERAIKMQIPGFEQQVLVFHPFNCVESKIANLGAFIKKRTREGAEQARLAIEAARCYQLQDMEPTGDPRRVLLKAAERFARLARTDAACYAFAVFGIDVLRAVPAQSIVDEKFKATRCGPRSSGTSRCGASTSGHDCQAPRSSHSASAFPVMLLS